MPLPSTHMKTAVQSWLCQVINTANSTGQLCFRRCSGELRSHQAQHVTHECTWIQSILAGRVHSLWTSENMGPRLQNQPSAAPTQISALGSVAPTAFFQLGGAQYSAWTATCTAIICSICPIICSIWGPWIARALDSLGSLASSPGKFTWGASVPCAVESVEWVCQSRQHSFWPSPCWFGRSPACWRSRPPPPTIWWTRIEAQLPFSSSPLHEVPLLVQGYFLRIPLKIFVCARADLPLNTSFQGFC